MYKHEYCPGEWIHIIPLVCSFYRWYICLISMYNCTYGWTFKSKYNTITSFNI